MSEDGRKILDEKIEAYLEERKQFVRGFARLVIRQGPGALCGVLDAKTKQPITWQTRGRQLYGVRLFNETFREELARREEWDHAEGGLSTIRGDQGKDALGGQTPGGSEDERSEDHERGGRPGAASTEASEARP